MKTVKYSLLALLLIFSSSSFGASVQQNNSETMQETVPQAKKITIARYCIRSIAQAATLSIVFTTVEILVNKLLGNKPYLSAADYVNLTCGLTCIFTAMDLSHLLTIEIIDPCQANCRS